MGVLSEEVGYDIRLTPASTMGVGWVHDALYNISVGSGNTVFSAVSRKQV